MIFRSMVVMMLAANLACELPGRADDGWAADPAVVAEFSRAKPEFNYEESRVPQYTLPDPLKFASGEPLTQVSQWPQRRDETIELFRTHVYGKRPPLDYQVEFEVVEEIQGLFGCDAVGRAVDVKIVAAGESFVFPLLVFIPGGEVAAKSLPAVVHINNRKLPAFADAATNDEEFWPAGELVKRGYVACAVETSTIDPDQKDGFENGIRGFFHRLDKHSPQTPAEDAWKALSAWGWGASRALDYLLTLPEVAPTQVAILGHSRGGKAALWAAAEDTRFSIACSNNSGCGGAALSRRAYGETVERITSSFPHWFCDRFAEYAGQETRLPVDQHQLFGLLAPRAVYATSAAEDLWADPRGEYLALLAASPVYEWLGERGISQASMPNLAEPRIEGKMGYHIRAGEHGLKAYDWTKFLDFCDLQWARPQAGVRP